MKRAMVVGWTAALFALTSCFASSPQEIQILGSDSGYLGVSIRDVKVEDLKTLELPREAGVVIESVAAGSPAEKAGLQKSDVILEFAGAEVWSTAQFRRLVAETPAGRTVELVISRAGGNLNLKAEIGEREGGSLAWFGREPQFWARRFEEGDLPGFHVERLPAPGRGGIRVWGDQPRLGISGTRLTLQMADFLGATGQEGVLVMEVIADTPAADAGIKAGDVVLSVDGHPVTNPEGLRTHLKGDSVELEILRNKQTIKVTVKLNAEEKRTRDSLKM